MLAPDGIGAQEIVNVEIRRRPAHRRRRAAGAKPELAPAKICVAAPPSITAPAMVATAETKTP
jgi:hypothetical protein